MKPVRIPWAGVTRYESGEAERDGHESESVLHRRPRIRAPEGAILCSSINLVLEDSKLSGMEDLDALYVGHNA